jgi:hypothetical protein
MKYMGKTTGIWLFTLALACAGCGDDDDDGQDSDGGGARGGSSGRGGSGASGKGGGGGTSGSQADGGPRDAGDDAGDDEDGGDAEMTFFVSSEGSATGDLGGLSGADARCERLAQAVGRGSATWRAYLSADADADDGGTAIHARDRIGDGPWHNSKGRLLAANLSALHSLASRLDRRRHGHGGQEL